MVCHLKCPATTIKLGQFMRKVQATILQIWQYLRTIFPCMEIFSFDEATDTIDGYIQKVKQVAALLYYGDPQILELFKNTLPSRLYYMLYHIDNLREAVEMAK